MSAKNKNFKPMLKYYHIFLLAIIICPFLISHSNSVNRRRKLIKDHEFVQNLFLRKLDFTSDTEAICSKGSEELKNYYLTRDDDSIGIKSDKIENKNNDNYVNALINLVASKGDINESAKEYVMHLIPVLVILVLAILSIPGWIFLCSCYCCGCCCCCCCKKNTCKIPFFIITAVFYAFVFGISVYGLSQSDSIFVGLADTECSILKFIDQVLSGEGENAPKPYWAGIDTIQTILRKTKANINSVKSSYSSSLNTAKSNIQTAKTSFENQLTTSSNNVKNDGNYLKLTNYKLDIVMKFGTYSSTPDPSNSDTLLQLWGIEFNEKASRSEELMNNMDSKFTILNSDSSVDTTLDDGINAIEPIKSSIDEVKNQISSIIIDYSDKIDKYGKLAFKIVFSVLMVLDAAIAALMTISLFFSFSCFDKCCCCKCFLKALVHILWNILALLTFLTFLIGFFVL